MTGVQTCALPISGFTSAGRDGWSDGELQILSTLRLSQLAPPAPDPSNAVEARPDAVRLGKQVFADPRFSRNRIRRELLPLLHEHYSRHVDESILRLSTLAREAQEIIDSQVEQLYIACARKPSTGDAFILKTNPLRSATPYLVRELLIRIWKEQGWPLRDMTAERWEEVATRACQQSSLDEPLNLPGNIRVEHTAQTLVITPPQPR